MGFYAKDWRGTKWVEFDPCDLLLPDEPGCYVVLVGGKAIYVGSSTRVAQRIEAHGFRYGYGSSILCPFGSFSVGDITLKVRFWEKWGDWAMRELRLINRLRPRFNTMGTGRKRKPNGYEKQQRQGTWSTYR